MAEANVLGALARGGEEDLGGGGVRVLFEEVVLDLEDVIEAELVGELDLFERLLIDAVLGVWIPGRLIVRLRELQFVEETELHAGASLPS